MADEKKDQDKKFWNAQDGVRGRDGGPYADEEDAWHREELRAAGEGRDPDYDNPAPFVGNQMVTTNFVEDNVYSNPSMSVAAGPNEALEEAKTVKDAPHKLSPVDLPVDTRTTLPDSEQKSQEKDIRELATDPANVATTASGSVEAEGSSTSTSTDSKPNGSKRAAAKRTASKK